jgi:HAD superfamily hydrolase (TIGR01450 family)
MRSLTDYDAYLFDVDGTLLTPGQIIPGAAEALAALKARGKAVRAVTNNSRLARHAVAERFRRYGLPFEDDEVFSALAATAQLIAHERPGARVFPFGGEGMRWELEQAGLALTDGEDAEYVVAGFHPEITHQALTRAMRAILGGARFVAVNRDSRFVGIDGLIPGAGAYVAAVERAVGRDPDVVVGKPSITIVAEAVASVRRPASSCIFVGDNLETDVKAAHAVGMDALLVLTGVATAEDLRVTDVPVEHVLPSLAELTVLLR